MHFRLFYRKVSLLLILLLVNLLTHAQMTVTGRVISMEDQKPVVGATVLIKGSNKQTITDQKATFSIPVSENETLVITSIRYANREIKASADLTEDLCNE